MAKDYIQVNWSKYKIFIWIVQKKIGFISLEKWEFFVFIYTGGQN